LKTFKPEWWQLSDLPLQKKLKLIKRPLKDWNRNVFGHIDGHISKFMQALNKVEEEAQRRALREDEWGRMDALIKISTVALDEQKRKILEAAFKMQNHQRRG